jgi:hypothetical protein
MMNSWEKKEKIGGKAREIAVIRGSVAHFHTSDT